MARSFLVAAKEQGERERDPAPRPVPRIRPVGRVGYEEAPLRVQWMADSDRAILVCLLDHDYRQAWIPLAYFRSDEVEMPGEAGVVVLPSWLARRVVDG